MGKKRNARFKPLELRRFPMKKNETRDSNRRNCGAFPWEKTKRAIQAAGIAALSHGKKRDTPSKAAFPIKFLSFPRLRNPSDVYLSAFPGSCGGKKFSDRKSSCFICENAVRKSARFNAHSTDES